MKKLLTFLPIATMMATPAFAGIGDYIPTGLELGLGLSATSGLNGFVGYANKESDSFWYKRLGVRLDFAATKPVKSTIDSIIDKQMGDGIEVGDHLTITDGTIDSGHFALLFDIYPFGNTWFLGGWRVSAGYVIGGMDVKSLLTGTDDSLSELAGKQFQLGDKIWRYNGGDVQGTGKLKWDYTGPYFGTGFDLGLFSGCKLFMDAGVVFTSKAAELSLNVPETAQLQYSNDGGSSWSNVNISNVLHNEIEKTLSDAQEKLNEYKFFPMVKVGFMYRF